MGGRRTTPPLFELLREAEIKADRSARIGAARDAAYGRPKPPPRPEPPREKPKREKKPRPEPATDKGREPWRLDSAKRVAIPLNAILIGTAGLILVVVVSLSVAWQLGAAGGERESRKLLDRLAPQDPVIDPLVEDLPVNETLLATPETPAPSKPAPTPDPARGRYVVASGFLESDPREAGFNYLHIASTPARIDKAEAARIATYFDQAGLEVVCVPVDPGARASNNQGLYDVFVLQGVPSDEFSARRNEREDLERRVAQLGRTWQREHAGTTDFQRPQWTKYTP